MKLYEDRLFCSLFFFPVSGFGVVGQPEDHGSARVAGGVVPPGILRQFTQQFVAANDLCTPPLQENVKIAMPMI